MHRLSLAVILSAFLVSCGGGSSGGGNTSSGGGTGGGGSTVPPGPVAVTSGGSFIGVNITLPAPVASPALNATMIGAAVPASSGSTSITLTNAPAVIHLSSVPTSGANAGQMIVALLGNGMTTGTTSLISSVTLSGPNDITIGTPAALTGGGGIGFRITLGGSAATGARTVFLKNAQGDITAYTGGLEILP